MIETYLLYLFVDFIAIICFSFYIKTKNKKKSMIFLILSFVVMFLLVALRGANVGTDYIDVAKAYQNLSQGILTKHDVNWFGYPLVYLCRFIGLIFGDSYFVFYFILAFFSLFFVFKGIIKFSENKKLSLILFITFCLYYQLMNQSRQMLAISIIFYAIGFIKEKKLIKYFLLILLAGCIHESALIMLPFYFIDKIKLKSYIMIIIGISVVIIGFYTPILEFLISKTSYSIYLNTIYNVSFKLSTLFNLVFRLMLFVFSYYVIKKHNKNLENNYLINLSFICTILQIITVKYYFLGRLTTYFFISYLYLIPIVYNLLKKNKNTKIVTAMLVVALISIYNVYYFSSSGARGAGYEKYSTIFTNKIIDSEVRK